MTKRRLSVAKVLLLCLVCTYAVGFGVLAARAYPAHETAGAYDLGNHVQALWNAARGQGLNLTLVPEFGPSRFSMHVEPTLFLFAPVFRFVTDDPRFLLWFQAIFIALGGLPLFGLARRRLGSEYAALALVAAYFLLPALQSITLFEFHAVGMVPTLTLAGLYFLDRALAICDDSAGIWPGKVTGLTPPAPGQRERVTMNACLSGLFFLVALGAKEDISLNVLMLGLYLVLFRRRWKPGLAMGLIGVIWFYVAAYVIVPMNRPDSTQSAYLGFFSQLGDTPLDILLSPFRTPGDVLGLLFRPDTLLGLAMLTLPLALTPWVGWPLLLPALPTLAISLLSANPMMHRLETYHYAAPALTFVMLAGVEGTARLADLARRLHVSRRRENGQAVESGRRRFSGITSEVSIALLILLISLVYQYYRGYSPLSRAFHWPQVTQHEQIGDRLAASIPPDAAVVAQAELVPLVARRPWVQIWDGPFDPKADYYLLDVSHPAFVNRYGAQDKLLADMAFDSTVGLFASEDGYLLLERGAPRLPTSPEFFSYMYADPPAGATRVDATFGDTLRLVAYDTFRSATDREAEPLLVLYWQVLDQPQEDYLISIFLLDEEGEAVGATLYQQPLTVWWPTSRWAMGKTIRMLANTFPWWTGDRHTFGYGIAVVSGDDPWDVNNRLPVSRSDDGVAPLDDNTVLPLVRFKRVLGIPYAQ